MKSERSVGRSRNSRLNRARARCKELLDQLGKVERFPHNRLISEAAFWEECRSLVADLSQCIHEANAYNNCMADDGTIFEQDEYSANAST
jgi:hypothetical protein